MHPTVGASLNMSRNTNRCSSHRPACLEISRRWGSARHLLPDLTRVKRVFARQNTFSQDPQIQTKIAAIVTTIPGRLNQLNAVQQLAAAANVEIWFCSWASGEPVGHPTVVQHVRCSQHIAHFILLQTDEIMFREGRALGMRVRRKSGQRYNETNISSVRKCARLCSYTF